MSAEEVLRKSETEALKNNQIISSVSGKKSDGSKKKKRGVFGAGMFVTAILAVMVVFFSSGNFVISAISDQLVEATDVQRADMVESKILVFQQALAEGDVPSNTAALLKQEGVVAGYIEDEVLVESNSHEGELVLEYNGEIISAGEFAQVINNNAGLYKAFEKATYGRAAYWYDESAKKVMREIGTTRNNYTAESDLEEVISSMMGEGSNIDINSVVQVEKTDSDGKKQYSYEATGENARSNGVEAASLVNAVAGKSTGVDAASSALQAAESLNVADTAVTEQRASLYYLLIMENLSKTKAGDGNEAKVNETLNYLYKNAENEVVDVNTGEVVTVSGSMMESPSLYAILSGEKIDVDRVENYAADRVLKAVENRLGVTTDGGIMRGTVASTTNSTKGRGAIGWYAQGGEVTVSSEDIDVVTPTINGSLINNSFDTLGGVAGGEFLVKGAVNVGKRLAKQSGATAGDAEAVRNYARLTQNVLALESEADRLDRSPFDITSRNTFLGSIVYKMAVAMRVASGLVGGMNSISSVVASAVGDLLPTTYADDGPKEAYLDNFGDCVSLSTVGAVGSAGCSEIATFDTSTLGDIFNDAGFKEFVEANTTLGSDGVRTINGGSDLARFILYNDERITPVGVTDGGILSSLKSEASSVPFLTDIAGMISDFLGADEGSLRIASGEAFVNSSSNSDWQTYKYAQRYVSLARATESLRQYDGDDTAYAGLRYFEGVENPVVAFLNNYYNVANLDTRH